ncbi:MCE family protein [Streptomyces sp. NBC_00344]|uniref:MCE family protein n=1 Tax=Streptomyces sp. NBC_00344 TaxID=2975720 RepID=UPI002E249E84
MKKSQRIVAIGAGVAVVAAVTTSGVIALDNSDSTRITAYFDQATGVYPGSDLRILGVKVGEVDSVRPAGDVVRVTLLLDKGVKVPADARAVVVAPSVVSDRYVQLAPAYTGGPRLKDRTVLPAARNATPVEVDQLYASITRLSTALGPKGANSQGALSDLLRTGAANLGGNGKAIGDSIEQLGKASKTLDGSSKNLFSTLSSLETFTRMLKDNDGDVRSTETQLAAVTGFLDDDKKNLGAALKELGTALAQVKSFISKNRGSLKKSIHQLVPITQSLVDQRASLAEALDTAPLAAGNVLNAYDPVHRTLDGRANINELSSGVDLTMPSSAGSLNGLVPAQPSRLKALPTLPLPAAGQVYGSPPKSAKADRKQKESGR